MDRPLQPTGMPRVPWPPVMAVGLLMLAFLARRWIALPWPGGPLETVLQAVGWLLVVLALGVELSVLSRFRAARTTVMPNRDASSLVTTGLLRYSRNPIYFAHVTLLAAMGLATGNAWCLAAAPVLGLALRWLAIRPEEAFLRSTFGDDYERYERRVRRWI